MDLLNQTIGKYKLTRLIGEGGMATVYEGEHETLDTKVAVKILNPILSTNKQIRERFVSEAKIMASFNHVNITKIIDFEEASNYLAIIMVLLEGQDLNDFIKNNSKLTDEKIISIFSQILAAFQYAHEKGVIHRDIKPSNIFILKDGTVKVLDFGIAKLFGQGNEMTQTGTQIGTPVFMSPEQVKSDKSIDHRSDVYSLGVMLYFLINGKAPYDSNTASQFDIFSKIVHEPLPQMVVQSSISHLVYKACQKKRELRFQSCEEFLDGLDCKNESLILENLKLNEIEITETSVENKKEINIYWILFLCGIIGLFFFTFVILFNEDKPLPIVELKQLSPDDIKFEWVNIPSGTFLMGSPKNEIGRVVEFIDEIKGNKLFSRKKETVDYEFQHEVILNSFKMSKYEVTFEQYDIYCEITGKEKPDDGGMGRGKRPVINITWKDANDFADYIGGRLPTEAEWEFACRAGTVTPFNTGKCLTSKDANINGDSTYGYCDKGIFRDKTLKVGSFQPNNWGLYDMHGNVMEWCSDLFDRRYYSNSPKQNPKGSEYGESYYRVVRGGSCSSYAIECRSSSRDKVQYVDHYQWNLGFRVVKSK